jgi:hypothetical protein
MGAPHSPIDAEFQEVGEQRRQERRRRERRCGALRLDPLFAATLVAQIERQETPPPGLYKPAPWRRLLGRIVNVRI